MLSGSSDRRIALVDVNNFYASCETVFDPGLRGRPVVVLSNNDGCVVARSAAAKAMKIKMAQPWHEVPPAVRKQTVAFSSNYTLYADMSQRVMKILREMAPHQEVYSIDESFLDLTGIPKLDAHGRQIRQRIAQWTGLTVCVGIGNTKTRAKLANYIAKKHPGFDGVFDLEALTQAEEGAWLDRIPVAEVWGVGARLTQQLNRLNIHTVQDLKTAPSKALREHFNVVVERIVAELNGVSCLELEMLTPPRQQIRSSRSFGAKVTESDQLKEAVVSYVARAAEKLRAQMSTASALNVFVATNIFKPAQPQYSNSLTIKLPFATDDTLTLAKFAVAGIDALYRPGYTYKKAGVNLMQLESKATGQISLFEDQAKLERRDRLNEALDHINRKFGRHALCLGRAAGGKAWHMKRARLSPAYTTSLSELLVLR